MSEKTKKAKAKPAKKVLTKAAMKRTRGGVSSYQSADSLKTQLGRLGQKVGNIADPEN